MLDKSVASFKARHSRYINLGVLKLQHLCILLFMLKQDFTVTAPMQFSFFWKLVLVNLTSAQSYCFIGLWGHNKFNLLIAR